VAGKPGGSGILSGETSCAGDEDLTSGWQHPFLNFRLFELQGCFSGFPIGNPTSFGGFRKLLSASRGQCSFSF